MATKTSSKTVARKPAVRDLALTTDFRDVLGELVSGHLGNPSLKVVFPGYNAKFPGLV